MNTLVLRQRCTRCDVGPLTGTEQLKLEQSGVKCLARGRLGVEARARRVFLDHYSASISQISPSFLSRTGSLKMKRSLPLSGYIGMVETFSSFQGLLQKDPTRAERLSDDTKNK